MNVNTKVMKMRGDECCPGRGKWVKIPLLPENVGKRSLNYLGTLERLTTNTLQVTVLKHIHFGTSVLGLAPARMTIVHHLFCSEVLL